MRSILIALALLLCAPSAAEACGGHRGFPVARGVVRFFREHKPVRRTLKRAAVLTYNTATFPGRAVRAVRHRNCCN
jgi:hypothetical protein